MALSNMNILSLNVGMSSSLAGLSSLLCSENLDLIFLQEVRPNSSEIESLLPGYKCETNLDVENPSRPGTALVWRSTVPVDNVINFFPYRIQVATLGPYFIVNVYGPSGSDKKHERENFYGQNVFNVLQLCPQKRLICGGDFNCILNPLDVEHGFGYNQKKSPALLDFVRVARLSDAFRCLYPNKEEYTFFRQGRASSKLDRVYVTAGMENKINNVSHVPSLSDHCGVKVQIYLDIGFAPKQESPRKSYWKLNNAILNDESFMPCFKPFWLDL